MSAKRRQLETLDALRRTVIQDSVTKGQGLSHKDLGFISIPLPAIKIQRDTVGKIEQQAAKQNQVRTGIETQIATLTAYRKSLIHECVTGQRQVTERDTSNLMLT